MSCLRRGWGFNYELGINSHPCSTFILTWPSFKYVVFTITLTWLTCLNVFGRKQPDRDEVDEAISCETVTFSVSAPTRNTFLLSLAPQSLLVRFFLCSSSKRVQGTGNYSRCFLNGLYFNKQRANQLEIISFTCLSSILCLAYFYLASVFYS